MVEDASPCFDCQSITLFFNRYQFVIGSGQALEQAWVDLDQDQRLHNLTISTLNCSVNLCAFSIVDRRLYMSPISFARFVHQGATMASAHVFPQSQ